MPDVPFAQLDVLDLACAVTAELLGRTGRDPNDVDPVIYGNLARPGSVARLEGLHRLGSHNITVCLVCQGCANRYLQ